MLQKKITNSKEFISKAKNLHGDKYDYSKVNYVNCSTKVCIICPKHGDFWTNPNNFIYRKTECPECAKKQQKVRQSMTTKEFVEKAKKVHGDRYDYSKVEYNGVHKQILLHCNKCGKDFWQDANTLFLSTLYIACNCSSVKFVKYIMNRVFYYSMQIAFC